jgi:putative DNA primase/helicase
MGEAPQILQWLIDGAVRYFEEGLIVPGKVKSESKRYFDEMDTVKAWADTCLRKVPGGFVPSRDLHEHYANWGEDTIMTATEFKKHLLRLGFTWKRTRKARGVAGVRIKDEFDPE